MKSLKLVAILVVLVVAALGLLLVFDIVSLNTATDATIKVIEAGVIIILASLVVGALAKSN